VRGDPMTRVEAFAADEPATRAGAVWLDRGVIGPVVLAAAAIALGTYAIVVGTPSAWQLLGVGRGFVPEAHYVYSGFVIILATTYGQFVGWAGGSALLAYVVGRVTRHPVTSGVVRGSMVVVYLGLSTLPLTAFHVLYGQPLLGLEREGLPGWLRQNYPDASLLVYTLHPVVDLSLAPLAVAVIGILWRASDARLARRALQLVLALLVLATSLAVALSLAIHSVLAHVRA